MEDCVLPKATIVVKSDVRGALALALALDDDDVDDDDDVKAAATAAARATLFSSSAAGRLSVLPLS